MKRVIQKVLGNHLVQSIIRVNFTSVTASRFMATNDSNRHTLLHTVLQIESSATKIMSFQIQKAFYILSMILVVKSFLFIINCRSSPDTYWSVILST